MRLALAASVALVLALSAAAQPNVDWDKETNDLLDRAISDNPFESIAAQDEIEDTGRACVPALRAALKSDKPQKRYFAAELLGKIHDASAVPDLIPLLEDLADEKTAEPVAAAAARALGRLGDATAGAKLTEKLDSTNADLRYEAIRALGLLRVKEAAPKILEILKKNETTETAAGGLLPLIAAEALGRLKSEEAIAEIAATLDKLAPETRSGWTQQEIAIAALERISGEKKGPAQGAGKEATVAEWKKWCAAKAPPKEPEKPPEKPPEPPKEPPKEPEKPPEPPK